MEIKKIFPKFEMSLVEVYPISENDDYTLLFKLSCIWKTEVFILIIQESGMIAKLVIETNILKK